MTPQSGLTDGRKTQGTLSMQQNNGGGGSKAFWGRQGTGAGNHLLTQTRKKGYDIT